MQFPANQSAYIKAMQGLRQLEPDGNIDRRARVYVRYAITCTTTLWSMFKSCLKTRFNTYIQLIILVVVTYLYRSLLDIADIFGTLSNVMVLRNDSAKVAVNTVLKSKLQVLHCPSLFKYIKAILHAHTLFYPIRL